MHTGLPNESEPRAGPSFGSIDPTLTIPSSSQDSLPQNALADWGSRMPGAIDPSFQEALGGTNIFYAASVTYPPYSDTSSGQTLLTTAHGFPYQDMSRPALSYPLDQMANRGTDGTTFCVPPEMERRQSVSETTDRSRSAQPMRPSSAFLCRDGRPLLTLDHDDHGSLRGVLSNSPEHASSNRSTERASEDGGIIQEPRTIDITPTLFNGTDAVIVSPLPLSAPIKWRRIPQRPYPPKTRDRSFLQLQRTTFGINGVPGINMKHALDQVFVGLDGRDDPVLESANGPVSCRLLFPGYPANTRCNQIAVRNWKKPPTPILRSKLAYEIAKRVNQYLEALTTITIDPAADPQWKVGQGCMELEKMYLVSVSWVAKGSVQPEIWVDTDYSWFGSTEPEPQTSDHKGVHEQGW